MRKLMLLVALLVATSVSAQVTIQTGSTLSQLINNLYGGNGIQLRPNGHQAHFGDSEDFQNFSLTLQKTLQARPVFPVPSSVGVVSFQFNEATGAYERVQSSLGPILAERATTSGKGHVNFAASYTFSDFETFNGSSTIPLTLRHCLTPACTFGNTDAAFLRDVIRVDMHLKLKSQVLATSVVYGWSDRVDVGIVLPYIRNDLNVFTHGSIVRDPASNPAIHEFDPTVETPDQLATGHALGIGDLILRGKMRLGSKLPLDLAVLADVTLPTGDEENFLGTGDTRAKATLIVSKVGRRFSPHLNAGYEVNVDTPELSSFDYRFGSELVLTPRLTVVGDVIGAVSPRAEDEFRSRALDDQSLIGKHVMDGVLGAKWLLTQRSLLNFNVIVPLNDEGIRPNTVVTFGVQTGL